MKRSRLLALVSLLVASCGLPIVATAQLSATDTRAAREALYVAGQAGKITAAQSALVNSALVASNGLSLKGNASAAGIVAAVRAATSPTYDGALTELLELIGTAPPPIAPAPPAPPPVVLPQPPPGSPTESTGYPGLTVVVPGELRLSSNNAGRATQDRITTAYKARIGINDWDGGYRILQNWQHEGTKLLPGGTIGMDSRAALSYNWWPAELSDVFKHPDNGPFTNTPGSALYDAYRGQALVIDGGSQAAYGYLTGAQLYNRRNILIAAQRAGQSIYFAVSPERGPNGDYPLNRAVMKLESSSAWDPNPVHIVVDGELRRIRSCDVGGQKVLCF